MPFERISTSYGGGESQGNASASSMSATGRYVVYASDGNDVVGGHANQGQGIYLRDMETGAVRRIDRAFDGSLVNGPSFGAKISADGRFVTYSTNATNILRDGLDDNGRTDIYIYDRETGETRLVTAGQDGTTANGRSIVGAISEDGRYVAYISEANDIRDAGDAQNGNPDTNDGTAFGRVARDVFVFDRVTGQTKIYTYGSDDRITQAVAVWAVDSNGVPSYSTDAVVRTNGGFEWVVEHRFSTPYYSGGGNPYAAPMAWSSEDGDYVIAQEAGNWNNSDRVFDIRGGGPFGEAHIRDLRWSDGHRPPNSKTPEIVMAANGRFVIYTSNFDVEGQRNTDGVCLYLWDMDTGEIVTLALAPAGDPFKNLQISANGEWITFTSSLALTDDDTNGTADIYRIQNPLGSVQAETEGDFPDGDHWIVGSDNDDELLGTAANDHISALMGADVVDGMEGDDEIDGHAGDDYLFGGEGHDVVRGGADNDILVGWAGDDILQGGDGDDELSGDGIEGEDMEPGADRLSGGAGDDVLRGDWGDDTLAGGTGMDRLEGGADDDSMNGEAGDDLLNGGEGHDSLWGSDGNDRLLGGAGDDVLEGDSRTGSAGHDELQGGDGDDELYGDVRGGAFGGGDDRLFGGNGDDLLDGGQGEDLLEGGAGDDTLQAGHGDDVLVGDSWNGDTGTGNDELLGGAGNDQIFGDIVTGSSSGGNDLLQGEAGDDILHGGQGADSLFGDEGDDRLDGGGGDDFLEGDDREAIAGNDELYGGDGDDEIHGDVVDGGFGGGDDLLVGGSGSDELYGGQGEDRLNGGDDDDDLHGGWGEDLLAGGLGHDLIEGGGDNDVIYGDLGDSGPTGGDDALHGEDGDDHIFGGGGGDLLVGGLGTDALAGEDGNDVLMADDYVVAAALSSRSGAAADAVGGDVLDGGSGADILHAGANSTLIGGSGSDTFVIDLNDGGTVIQDLRAGAGGDVVSIQNIWPATSGWDGDTNLFATGHLRLETRGSDTVVLFDADGSEGAGEAVELVTVANTAPGALTSANIRLDGFGHVVNDPRRTSLTRGGDESETLTGTEGHDTIQGLGGDDLILGLGGHDDLNGGEGADDLRGGAGDDLLSGGENNDTLNGGDGDDVLSGGSGTDILNGGDGDDRFLLDSGRDLITGGGGRDTIVASRYTTATTVIEDFTLGEDVVDMSALQGLNFEYLQAFMLSTDAAGDVLIRVDGLRRSYISLKGVKLEDLTAADFRFWGDPAPEPEENGAPSSVSIDNASVAENAAAGTVVGVVSGVDPDGDALVYALADDAGGRFSIDAATGVVTTNAGFDHEATPSFDLVVRATDSGGLFVERTITIHVGDVNEAPVSIVMDDVHIDENAPAGAVVGTASAADPESGALTYSLVDDADGLFVIDPATGMVTATRALNHETEASFDLVVRATDAGGLFVERTITVVVDDVNEAPLDLSMDRATVAENAAAGTLVGTASAGDPEGQALVYSLADDAGGLFVIDALTGAVTTTRAFDHEGEASFDIVVRATDPGGLFVDRAQTVTIGDVDEAPTILSLDDASVRENAPAGAVVGTAVAEDPEGDAIVYSLVDDAEGRFRIDPATGRITTTRALDHEATPSLRIVIRATDAAGLWVDREAVIAVEDVPEGPTGTDDGPLQIDEDATSANLWSQLLANDVSGGGALSIASVDTTGSRGSVIFDAATQTLRYVADADSFDLLATGATATDTFSYTVVGADGLTSTATVTFTIRGVADGRVIKGTNGKDTLTGTAGEDVITGLNGNDILHGLDGADRLDGGNGVDKLYGGNGIDTLVGGNGDDLLDGGAGADTLEGGHGQDQLFGGVGDDFIIGGGGHDLLTGGAGADTFVFGVSSDIDKILDFEVGKDSLSFVDGVEVLFHEILDNNNDGKLDTVLVHSLGGVVILLGVEYPVGPSLEDYLTPTWCPLPVKEGPLVDPIEHIL